MVVHTFHLAKPGVVATLGALWRPPTSASVAGLQHAECMFPMKLGASILSPGRWQVGRLAMFAAWESEAAVDEFLAGTKLGKALAAGWPWRTISTFTVWHSAREMTDMVHGRSAVQAPDRHATAMVERRRKDFHLEFTTLRFSCLSEHGAWEGRTSIVPAARSRPAIAGESMLPTS